MIAAQHVVIHPRLVIVAFCPALGADLDEIPISFIGLRQQDQMSQLLPSALLEAAPAGDIDLAAHHRMDALLQAFPVEIDDLDAVLFTGLPHIRKRLRDAVIRDGQRGLPEPFYIGHQIGDAADAVKQTVFGMYMQMYEWVHIAS